MFNNITLLMLLFNIIILALQFQPLFCQQYATKALLLTGAKNELLLKSTDYRAPDQCVPYMPQPLPEEARTFGLLFRLPLIGGSCDDGVLICYPGTLDSIIDSDDDLPNLRASKQFQVDNDQNDNYVTRECTKHWSNVTWPAEVWHGIYVYTKRKEMRMKMSISSNEYSFDLTQRQFFIHFGNRSDIFTYVTYDNGEQRYVNESDDALRTDFLDAVRKGANLQDFAGLWMLGLDILPYTQMTNIHLFTYRGCQCSMDVWFTKPTDSEEPDQYGVPIGSATKCQQKTDQTFPISMPENSESNDNFAVVITALTDEQMEKVEAKLKDSENTTIVWFDAGTRHPFKILFPKNLTQTNLSRDDDYFEADPNSLLKLVHQTGSYKIELRIELHPFGYAFRLNGNQLGRAQYFPKEWWNGSRREQIRKIKLNAEIMLLGDPIIIAGIEPVPTVPLHYTKFYGNICSGTTFTFRVQLIGNETFSISLLHDRPEHHEKIGSTLFQINVNPALNNYEFINLHDSKHQMNSKAFDFKSDGAYQFTINITATKYEFYVNDTLFYNQTENVLPAWLINFVRVDEIVNLLEEPTVETNECKSPADEGTTKTLSTLLNYGDIIEIVGVVKDNAVMFGIYLLHETAVFTNSAGDVPLRLKFDFGEHKTVSCHHWLFAEKHWEPGKHANFTHYTLLEKQEIKLRILMANDGFYGSFDGSEFLKFCDYYINKKQTFGIKASIMPLPPFAIDHIHIEGDLDTDQSKIRIDDKNETGQMLGYHDKIIEWTRIPYKQINKTDGLLQVNESIIVLMTVDKTFNENQREVCVFFYNEALAYHDLIGKTVLKILLTDSTLIFSRHYPRTWNVSEDKQYPFPDDSKTYKLTNNMANLLKPNAELNFTITVKATSTFELELNGNGKFLYEQTKEYPLPAWATQYITANFTGVSLSSAVEVICVPENRCNNYAK